MDASNGATGPIHAPFTDGVAEDGPRLIPLAERPLGHPHLASETPHRRLPLLASTRRQGVGRPSRPQPPGRLADVIRRAVDRLRGRFARLSAELGQLDGGGLAAEREASSLRRMAIEMERLSQTLGHLGDLVEPARSLVAPTLHCEMSASPADVLGAVVAEARTYHEGRLPNIVVDADCHDSVAAPSGALLRILRTLLRNAIEAAGSRGEVVLTSVGYDDAVEIEVADSGHGLSGHARAWLFEPGFSTKTDGEGLALAAAGCLAERFGGGIDVIDCPDGGTAFILRLPRPAARQRAA